MRNYDNFDIEKLRELYNTRVDSAKRYKNFSQSSFYKGMNRMINRSRKENKIESERNLITQFLNDKRSTRSYAQEMKQKTKLNYEETKDKLGSNKVREFNDVLNLNNNNNFNNFLNNLTKFEALNKDDYSLEYFRDQWDFEGSLDEYLLKLQNEDVTEYLDKLERISNYTERGDSTKLNQFYNIATSEQMEIFKSKSDWHDRFEYAVDITNDYYGFEPREKKSKKK